MWLLLYTCYVRPKYAKLKSVVRTNMQVYRSDAGKSVKHRILADHEGLFFFLLVGWLREHSLNNIRVVILLLDTAVQWFTPTCPSTSRCQCLFDYRAIGSTFGGIVFNTERTIDAATSSVSIIVLYCCIWGLRLRIQLIDNFCKYLRSIV